jgi:hypothetical protein
VPATVIVRAGQNYGTFTVTTKAVGAVTSATITAALNGKTETAGLTISPAVLESVTLSKSTVTGGSPSTGTVNLTGNLFSGTLVVMLSSSNASALVPKSVTIAAGASSATFNVTTKAVSTQKTVTITAKSGAMSKTTTLTVFPPTVGALKLSPPTVAPGGASTGTVTITGPAPAGGLAVALSSNSSKVTMPAKVTVPAGQTTANFSIKVAKTAPAGTVTIAATQGGATQTAKLTIS